MINMMCNVTPCTHFIYVCEHAQLLDTTTNDVELLYPK